MVWEVLVIFLLCGGNRVDVVYGLLFVDGWWYGEDELGGLGGIVDVGEF